MAIIHLAADNTIIKQMMTIIGSGNYQTGDRLPSERELAKTIGTNRNTLREALKVMQAMNIIDIRQVIGIYFLKTESLEEDVFSMWIVLHKEDIKNLNVVRETLEMKAIELIPIHKYLEVSEALKKCLSQLNPNTCTVAEFMENDFEFHSIITKASNNDVLATVYADLSRTVFDERNLYANTHGRIQMSHAEHTVIAESFATESHAFVTQVVIAHSASVRKYILQL